MSTLAQTAELVWGYTMADVDNLAWGAIKRNPRAAFIDTEERYAAAWHAIVVALYDNDDSPTFHELLMAGLRALDEMRKEEAHHHGRAAGTHNGEAPNFVTYWRAQEQPSDGFSDHLTEVLALPAVLGVLTPEQYEAITTLAMYDNDITAAANALGLTYGRFYKRVHAARRKIKEAWFGDETPIQRGNPADTCRSGHPRARFGEQLTNGTWRCRKCRSSETTRRYYRNKQLKVAA